MRPGCIDGAMGDNHIANIWTARLGSILNSVKDEGHRKDFLKKYHNQLRDVHIDHVTIEEIKSIVNKMKDGKAVDLDNVPNKFFVNVPLLF